MNVFVFDIETVPDVESGRRLYDLENLDDADVAKAMLHLRQQQTGSEFLPLHLHRICAISAVLRSADSVRVWSLGEAGAPEAELVQGFFDAIDRLTPTLVSWNGGGFDLPVLHYRALLHGVPAPGYWNTAGEDRDVERNNDPGRHTDLMDALASHQVSARAGLDEIAGMLGFPGKTGMSGARVWDAFQAGEIDAIRASCETDALNIYLVYLRFELIRGRLSVGAYQRELELLRVTLGQDERNHIRAFLQRWA